MNDIFKSVVEQNPLSILITDIGGRINYVNPKFTELTGYKPEEAAGKTPNILKSGVVDQEEYKCIWETVLSGKVWKGEIINKKKNGELYNEFGVISPVIDEEGNITQLIILKEDITALQRIEEELHNNYNSLSAMMSYLSHEIKSPLSAIKIHIDTLIRKYDADSPVNQSLSVVQSEITRLFNLLKHILGYSVQGELSFLEIDLPEFIECIKNIFMPQLKEKGIKFINNIQSHKISGDVQKLKSVFILLIEKSISAINENGVIEISSNYNDMISSINIRCSGCRVEGIKDISALFSSAGIDECGLGMAIAREIIERHNGEIEFITSKPDFMNFQVIFSHSMDK